MIKYTKHNLNKLEDIFRELKITLRYEKGNFHAGFHVKEFIDDDYIFA